MKRLLILRHAKSSWADSSLDDWERPLNDRGRRDAPRVGEWLREQSLVPDVIIASDAVRARTTAEVAAQAAGYSRDIVINPALYEASTMDILGVVREAPADAQSVMVVAHNPGLSTVVRQLTGEHHELTTAALVVLDVSIDSWSDLNSASEATVAESWQPRETS